MSVGDDCYTVAASGPVAIEIDLGQYQLSDGPCLRSVVRGRKVRLDLVPGDID